ncbi:anti-sigma-W factor RsiW [Pullulanibacillus camelliae]|uniref:Anti-sigma-W factor RsiW n=1 Tax=Pullulanibacillus camelliae TaxID=1707096 RepID=A0A8J2YNE9_9BACL|nr:anti-sigma factor [Pullulanibacillus camelliae]GGE55685.1 anti-sigma-W factor RsiW [Pullulanibacillus camelliae]
MACSKEMSELIQRALDQEANEGERHALMEHLDVCSDCCSHYNELKETIDLLTHLDQAPAPDYFTQKVIARLPDQKQDSKVLKWFKKHPIIIAAACFLIMMVGYIMSLWNDNSFKAEVHGEGKLVYSDNNTVTVPKGETIKGDLVITDGKVRIEGRVDGDVVLIHSDSLMASAGHVSGKIENVNQILGWIWYHIQRFFSSIFFIHGSMARL